MSPILFVLAAFAQEPPTAPAPDNSDVAAPTESEASSSDVPAEAAETTSAPEIRFRGQVTPEDAHYDLELLYTENRFDEGLAQAKQQLSQRPSEAPLYWHVPRFMFEIAETFERDDASIDKEAYYEEMLSVANRGLEKYPEDPHIRFARGVAAGRLGTTRGVLSSLWSAKGIEQDWLYTANSDLVYASIGGSEQLPCDANHALGIFYRLVPDSFIIQLLAGTRGSLAKSESFLTEANDRCPNRIATMKELAVTKICRAGKKDAEKREAGEALIHAYLKIPAQDEKDEIDHRHGKLLLSDPGIACGYSRDGQQDLDTSKLEK